MKVQDLTPEQIEDIKVRELKGIEALKGLQLGLSASTQSVNIGNDIFATKIIPFLQDTKFLTNADEPKITDVKSEPIVSPFTPNETDTPSA